MLSGARALFLGAAVALAFADSSIVVLAAPELLRDYDASIGSVAWMITSYNVAVALGALALVRAAGRIDPRRLARVGLAGFLGASLACAFAPSLAALVAFRAAHGAAAAALLVGSLPLARALAGDAKRGTSRWALAGLVGTAVGPALGGLLTQAFDWRAIFLAQAPVAALALSAVRVQATERYLLRTRAADGARLRRLGANTALALLSGALVGALFLAVVLVVDVWGYTPLRGALVVSALPAAALAAHVLARRLDGAAAVATGALLVAAGLAGLALLPGSGLGWILAPLVACGAGVGLALQRLASVERGDAVWSLAARHTGLVAALVLVTPLLADDVSGAASRAERAGTALVLDAPLPAATKVPLALDLARTIQRTPHGSLPELRGPFAERGRSPGLARLERSLDGTLRAVVTRSFRRAFFVCALFAALVLVPVALVRRPRALVPALVAAVALLGAELARGGFNYGGVAARDPCRAPPTVPGPGVDRTLQRIALRGLDEIACHVGTSREQLLLDAAAKGQEAADLARRYERRARDWLSFLTG